MPTAATEDLLRELAPQVLGALVRRYGHFAACEDAVQEALLAATLQWPREGRPANPRAWLVTVAARRLTDQLRSEGSRRRREDADAAATPADAAVAPPVDADAGSEVPADRDDTLHLLFLCCHPALSPDAQVALTLRAALGALRPCGPLVLARARRQCGRARQPGFPHPELFRPDPQFPPLRLAADVSVRRLPGSLRLLFAGARAQSATAGGEKSVFALRDEPADERGHQTRFFGDADAEERKKRAPIDDWLSELEGQVRTNEELKLEADKNCLENAVLTGLPKYENVVQSMQSLRESLAKNRDLLTYRGQDGHADRIDGKARQLIIECYYQWAYQLYKIARYDVAATVCKHGIAMDPKDRRFLSLKVDIDDMYDPLED